MPIPEFYRLRRGGPIPAAWANALSEAVEALRSFAAPVWGSGGGGGLEFGVPVIPAALPVSFLARIDASDGGTPPAFSWTAMEHPDDDGNITYTADLTTGGPADANPPAYCTSENYPPTDGSAIVRLWPSLNGDCWEFEYQGMPATVSGPVTFTGPVTFNGGPITISGTTNETWNSTGVFNFTAGSLTFPSSSSLTVAPTALFVLPHLTVVGLPTFVTPVGTLICGPGKLFQSTGPGTYDTFPANPVTSITADPGIVLTPDPITSTGSIGLDLPVAIPHGGTGADLSTTGGTKQYVKQATTGGVFTVGTLPYTDVQSVPSGQLMGRGTAGTGAMEAITVGSGLSLTGTTLSASGGSGTTGTNNETTLGSAVSLTADNTWTDVLSLTIATAGTYLMWFSATFDWQISALGVTPAGLQARLQNTTDSTTAGGSWCLAMARTGAPNAIQSISGTAIVTTSGASKVLKLQCQRQSGPTWTGSPTVDAGATRLGYVRLA